MSKVSALVILLILLSVPVLSYGISDFPYSDPPSDMQILEAVEALTEDGILEGHPDGTFKDGDLLNRAEFMKIAMKLVPESQLPTENGNCFPDVSSDTWFSKPVCGAKKLGIVSGNAIQGIDPSKWFFEPSRPVNYAEALKIIIEIYEERNPLRCFTCLVDWAGEWYYPYLLGARDMGIALENLDPGKLLTRGEIARLVFNMLVFEGSDNSKSVDDSETGDGSDADSEAQSGCELIICGDGRKFESCDSKGEPLMFTGGTPCFDESAPSSEDNPSGSVYDPDTDVSTDSEFLILGDASAVLGSVEVFNNSEPFDVTKITVIFTSASGLNSIEALKIYDEYGEYIGRANRDTSEGTRHYVLNLKSGSWTLDKRESRYIYVRAILVRGDSGGVSGETAEIEDIRVEGLGMWSNRKYSQTDSDDYNSFQTALSGVTGIANAGNDQDLLTEGTGLLVGLFRFEGKRSSGTADLRVTQINFTVGTNDGVAVSNMQLGSADSNEKIDCSVSGSSAVCGSIPDYLGSFKPSPRTIQIFADVSIPDNALRPSLQLTINNPGSAGSAGDITWTDGTSVFTWVPFGTPVVRGTYFGW